MDDIRARSSKQLVGRHLTVSMLRQGFELAVWPARAGPSLLLQSFSLGRWMTRERPGEVLRLLWLKAPSAGERFKANMLETNMPTTWGFQGGTALFQQPFLAVEYHSMMVVSNSPAVRPRQLLLRFMVYLANTGMLGWIHQAAFNIGVRCCCGPGAVAAGFQLFCNVG